MKNVLAVLIYLIVLTDQPCISQKAPILDSCRASFKTDVVAFIPGYRDTVMNNQSVMALDPSSLVKAFELPFYI